MEALRLHERIVDGDEVRNPSRWLSVVRLADKAGHVAQQPPTWAGWTAVIAFGGGERGRRAAARAGVGYVAAAVVANLVVKPLVQRPRPRKARKRGLGPVTSSFPSGHAATHLAFIAGSARELPVTFFPLAASALLAHWSIVRSRGHHPTDVVFGGFLGLGVALLVNKLWPGPPVPSGASDAPVADLAVADDPGSLVEKAPLRGA